MMKLTHQQYEQVLGWASGEADTSPEAWCDAGLLPRARSLASLWSDVEGLVRDSACLEPSTGAIRRALKIPAAMRRSPVKDLADAASNGVNALLGRLDALVARLVHDDRRMPLAVRGEVGQAVHLAWEAGELDIDVVAEPAQVDPVSGSASNWVIRGEVMADGDVAGLEVCLVDTRDGAAVETASLDGFGQFVMEAPAGVWAIRIGSDDQHLHLEPLDLE